ncbi:hypothetical protein [Melittangium boletus]|uniref:Tryptophan synthase alpha chain n=1 Tax=Melittangium boletus DSM 14713 TaxID=1294270 RepID=A0A250I711_9BACT|nr:hypothetical protein [Melittangium boletus]ATB27659.1 hypothetical protein MEBOL_001103 [Melittangium boletus DSM 14713]
MRRLLFIASTLIALVAAGCPLVIQVRCDDSFRCDDGEACVAGACVQVALESAQVGAACTSDATCGAGLTCGMGFPGGYCLAPCGAGDTCASGSVCVKELGRCMRACGETCGRPGYACTPVPQPGSSTWACAPTSSNGGDGGTDPAPSEDAGCAGQVPLNEHCAQACDCAPPGADCVDSVCVRACTRDSDCSDGSRCNETWHRCEEGPRLGEACRESRDCPGSATCNAQRRCKTICNTDWSCPLDYRCAPDSVCVNECTNTPPETVGLTCETSLDCARCGFCVASGTVKQCRQPCLLDRDCPGGAVGSCEQVGSTALRACRLP